MDRPGVCQVPEGSEEQGDMEKTGCKLICGAPTTLAVKGLMMMMMMPDDLEGFRFGRRHTPGRFAELAAKHIEIGKKTEQTEQEVGRQHQGMDKPGVRQVPEGSGEQGEMEKTGCKLICGAPTTLTVKG